MRSWDLLQTIHANQLIMLRMLRRILNEEDQKAIDLTAITADVAANTSAANSAIQLLNNLTAIIKAIPPSNDPTTQAALDSLAQTLEANNTAIANAVTANTPSAP